MIGCPIELKGEQPMATEHRTQSEDRLKAVSAAFAEWRRCREKRSPIPEDLWQAAAMLSPHYSTYRIARELRLDYAKLKLRIAETAAPDNGPEFFELKAESLFAAGGCSIHLRSPEGFHMVIRAETSSPSQFLPLINTFLSRSR